MLRALDPSNALLTLQSVLELPIEESGIGMESSVIYQVAQFDIDLAKSMLPQARNGRTRLRAQIYIGWTLSDLGDTDQALEFANEVSENEREYYYDNLSRNWAFIDMRGAYQAIEQLPSSRTRSRAAMWILYVNEQNESLSDDEINRLKNYLSDDDADELASGDVRAKFPEN